MRRLVSVKYVNRKAFIAKEALKKEALTNMKEGLKKEVLMKMKEALVGPECFQCQKTGQRGASNGSKRRFVTSGN